MKHFKSNKWTTVLIICIALNGLAIGNLPSDFYKAMSGIPNEETLCFKNYDAGASFIESYMDFEHLDKDTQVVSRSYNISVNPDRIDSIETKASLDAHINSNIIGNAHIAWQSLELVADPYGRHTFYSGGIEELTGVFSVDKYIALWSNSSINNGLIEWLPCT